MRIKGKILQDKKLKNLLNFYPKETICKDEVKVVMVAEEINGTKETLNISYQDAKKDALRAF